jgi:hypothetical protein
MNPLCDLNIVFNGAVILNDFLHSLRDEVTDVGIAIGWDGIAIGWAGLSEVFVPVLRWRPKNLFVDLKKCTFTYFTISGCNIIPIILGY